MLSLKYGFSFCPDTLLLCLTKSQHSSCIFRDAIICCAADGFTSLYGGFVIFSVIGYIAHDANMNITDVATSGMYGFHAF